MYNIVLDNWEFLLNNFLDSIGSTLSDDEAIAYAIENHITCILKLNNNKSYMMFGGICSDGSSHIINVCGDMMLDKFQPKTMYAATQREIEYNLISCKILQINPCESCSTTLNQYEINNRCCAINEIMDVIKNFTDEQILKIYNESEQNNDKNLLYIKEAIKQTHNHLMI